MLFRSNISRTKVPIEDSGAVGTVGAHWENSYRPPNYQPGEPDYPAINDIMIGWASNLGITNISINLLRDLGYSNTPVAPMVFSALPEDNISYEPVRCGCGSHLTMIPPPISMIYMIYDHNKKNIRID